MQEDKLQRQSRAPPQYGLLPAPPLRQAVAASTNLKLPLGTRFKMLSWTKMQGRCDKGLCYNCDERFVPDHKCKNQQVYMLETMLESEEVEENEEATTRETQQLFHRSLYMHFPEWILPKPYVCVV